MKERTRSERILDEINEMLTSDIGSKIARRRKELKISTTRLSAMTGISEMDIKRIESSGSNVKRADIEIIAKALDTDFMGIMTENYGKENLYDMGVDYSCTKGKEHLFLSRKEKEVLNAYRNLKPGERKVIDRALGIQD